MSSDTAGPIESRDPRDHLDTAGRTAARRGWMRTYLRSSAKVRLAELDELVQSEVEALEASTEPTP